MSDLSPLSGEERKSNFGAVRSVDDLGCVKTCTSRECAELVFFLSFFDGDCQSGSFLIQRNRDKLSTRKFGVGVFTPAWTRADVGPLELPTVREAVTGAMMPAIRLPTNGLRLLRRESTCLNEPLPHDRQKAVGFSHITVAFF